jgi:hypothetical protein
LGPNQSQSFQSLSEQNELHQAIGGDDHTLIKLFFGCFLSSLLHVTIADLFDPVSIASVVLYKYRCQDTYIRPDRILGVFGGQELLLTSRPASSVYRLVKKEKPAELSMSKFLGT